MDGDAGDLELLLSTAASEVATLRHDPRLELPSGSRGAALRTHLEDLLGAVEHRMQRGPAVSAPSTVRRAFARNMRQSILVLRAAHAALPWLAATREPNLNMGSLYLTEEYARVLVGPKVDLVVVPDSEFMYSTTSWPFKDVIANTKGFPAVTQRRPIVLNYPLSDSDRLLLHPIFGHELGHPGVDEHDLVADLQSKLDGDPDFSSALSDAVNMMGHYWAADASKIAGSIRARLGAWIEELLCDHLAVEAAGPAYLWAFASFVIPLSYGEPAPSHPPNTLRVKLLLDQLADRGWIPFMERVAPVVTVWLNEIASHAGEHLEPPYGFLRDQVIEHAPLLREAAEKRAGNGAFKAATSTDASDEAAHLLERLILPVGLDAPLDPRCILLGGWQEAFRRHGDGPSGLVKALNDQGLQDLIGKAIEMSVVTSMWKGAA